MPKASARRVVITGLGCVTGLGAGARALWEGLSAGRSALRPITRFDTTGFPTRLGAEIGPGPDGSAFSAKDFVPKHYRKAVKVMARDIELAVAAAKDAVEDAGLATRGTLPEDTTDPTTYRGERMGCHIGAGLIAAEGDELAAAFVNARADAGDGTGAERLDLAEWGRRGMDHLTPLWLLKYLPNMLACHVTIIHGCEGPSNTITCAEASGLLSIAESTRVIERGAADLCFSGGAESKLNFMGLLRMDFAGRIARTGEATEGAGFVRPFDPQAGGGLLGEAGGILILEAEETARKRGAKAYAEVAGLGAAHSPPEWAKGAGEADEGYQAAVEMALRDAGIGPGEVDAIVPGGIGVATQDRGEAAALRAVFGVRLGQIPLITLAPMVGNCMAGTGGVMAAVGAKCLREQRLPARLHGGRAADGLDAGPAPARDARLQHVLVATPAMGGQNAAIVLRAV
jgi:3-oxoacyl-[acyl-carrier-protein] synthase II